MKSWLAHVASSTVISRLATPVLQGIERVMRDISHHTFVFTRQFLWFCVTRHGWEQRRVAGFFLPPFAMADFHARLHEREVNCQKCLVPLKMPCCGDHRKIVYWYVEREVAFPQRFRVIFHFHRLGGY